MRYFLVLCLVLFAGCSSIANIGSLSIGEHEFIELNDVKLLERTQDEDLRGTFGLVADIHGDTKHAQKIADRFVSEQVEYVFILGDSSLNGDLRSGDSTPDEEELVDVWTIFGETKLPVFIMAGNHEGSKEYNSAMKKVQRKYKNIVDMMQYRILDADDVSFIAVPGYHDKAFLPEDGYQYTENDLSFIPEVARAMRTRPFLLTHGPPRSEGEEGVDFVPGVGNVGDEKLNAIMERSGITYAFSGHIHEAGGRTSEKGSHTYVNIGAGEEGKAAMVLVEEGEVTVALIGN